MHNVRWGSSHSNEIESAKKLSSNYFDTLVHKKQFGYCNSNASILYLQNQCCWENNNKKLFCVTQTLSEYSLLIECNSVWWFPSSNCWVKRGSKLAEEPLVVYFSFLISDTWIFFHIKLRGNKKNETRWNGIGSHIIAFCFILVILS